MSEFDTRPNELQSKDCWQVIAVAGKSATVPVHTFANSSIIKEEIGSRQERIVGDITLRISPLRHRNLLNKAKQADTDLFKVLHCCIAIAMAKFFKKGAVAIGVAAPASINQRMDPGCGLHGRMALLLTRISGNSSFCEVLAEVKELHLSLSGYKDSKCTGEQWTGPAALLALDKRTEGMHGAHEPSEWMTRMYTQTHGFPLAFDVAEYRAAQDKPEGIEGKVYYDTGLFNTIRIQELLDEVSTVLGNILLLGSCSKSSNPADEMTSCGLPDADLAKPFTSKWQCSPHAYTGCSEWRQRYIPPYDALQCRLISLVEDLEKVSRIGIRDRLVENSGDRDSMTHLVGEAEKVFGRNVPVPPAVGITTVEKLARHMAGSIAHSRIYQVQPGDPVNPPLFWVHGDVFGAGWYAFELSKKLGNTQPFYTFPPHGLNGYKNPGSIEEMARDNIETLRSVQQKGPYRLGGYCNGALIAFEMARLLELEGEETPFLAMVEPPRIQEELDCTLKFSAGAGSSSTGRAWILNEIILASALYLPKKYSGRVLLIRAQEEMVEDTSELWRRMAEVELCSVPGNHMSCIGEHSFQLASTLKEHLHCVFQTC